MSINNDRKRPFLEEPVYHGCPISWAERFFQGKVSEFRKTNKEFDLFLIGIEQEIKNEKLIEHFGVNLLTKAIVGFFFG